jgi:hypothetical protein
MILLIIIGYKVYSQDIPLPNAYAHNDYWHKHPLFDALDNGFTKVEADVYLRDDQLIVAHILPILSRKRTLENLYLEPIRQCINNGDKRITGGSYPLLLMIDIKSAGESTYEKLEQVLEKYRPILSSYQNGVYTQRYVTVVLTGHKPLAMLKAQQSRVAFMDEDLLRVRQDTINHHIYQTASCKYSRLLKWRGKGEVPADEQTRLCAYVAQAHKRGEKVRLWASPENAVVWKELLNCGVDLINTDKLPQLRSFLLAEHKTYAKAD